MKWTSIVACSVGSCLQIWLAPAANAQTFQFAPGQLPQGNPFNNSYTENIDFGDVDQDGDIDAVSADGGDCCNDQNRIWINLGFAQGGTVGFFADRTAQLFPAVLDTSRDMDFVDYDGDGDLDLGISNVSELTNQANRFWTNMGGLQGGTLGFFQDQTAARWLDLGINNGTTLCSSIAPSLVLPSGGFIDHSCDSAYGDLDNDGDMDLFHSSYGGAFSGTTPSRVFLNDGQGQFREYNPPCFQLPGVGIANGSPALWAQGTHQHGTMNSDGVFADIANTPLGIELGDIDADFDIDILQGSRSTPPPRLFRNMRAELGTLIWRDRTFAQVVSPPAGTGNYEQEWGDMDLDGDLDTLGVNWVSPFLDAIKWNDGTGIFGVNTVLSGSASDDNDGEFLDYDNDGDMDILIANFSGQERLYDGDSTGAFQDVTATELPIDNTQTLAAESGDIDGDGDYDAMVANNNNQANALLLNVGQFPDTYAALLPHLEQAPHRAPSSVPTVVRVHIYDNVSWDVLRYNTTSLEWQLNGGVFSSAPMTFAGGQLFRGEIPGTLVGTIGYRVSTVDEHGNVGTSTTRTYISDNSTCTGSIASYCTPKVSSLGCVPSMASLGAPSLVTASAFLVIASQVNGGQNGVVFFGTTGQNNAPFFGGTLCVGVPLYRLNVKNTSGTQGTCAGLTAYSLAEFVAHPSGGALMVSGQTVNAQLWFRDPPDPQTVGLSNGLQFTICP